MNKSKIAFIAFACLTGAAIVIKMLKKKPTPSPVIVKKEDKPVSETKPEIDKLIELEEEKTFYDYTYREMVDYYRQKNRPDDQSAMIDVKSYLMEQELINQPIEQMTMLEIGKTLTNLNNQLKRRYEEELAVLQTHLMKKPTRMVCSIHTLPEELKSDAVDASNVAFTYTFREKHILEGKKRINAVTKKYLADAAQYANKSADVYIHLIALLVQMHKDLKRLEMILPSPRRTQLNVNIIGELKFGEKKKTLIEHLGQTLPADIANLTLVKSIDDWFGKYI